MHHRVHILGASGTGTTTLGRNLAAHFAISHFDADDFFWLPTDPPFQQIRPRPAREELLTAQLSQQPAWVLSGSIVGWDRSVVPLMTQVIYLYLDPIARMARLWQREVLRYGARIEPGGDMHDASTKFMAWAGRYDTAGTEQRSRVTHEQWLQSLRVPVTRLDTAASAGDCLRRAMAALGGAS